MEQGSTPSVVSAEEEEAGKKESGLALRQYLRPTLCQ